MTGRVEKTDPRSADYPLTPAPRTTLRTTPRTTLRTTPTDYPKKSTKFLLRSTKIQKAYLLFLHDHNCTKNSRRFLFQHFSTQSFSLCPILHRPERCFHNGRSVSAVEYYLCNLPQVFAIDIKACSKRRATAVPNSIEIVISI